MRQRRPGYILIFRRWVTDPKTGQRRYPKRGSMLKRKFGGALRSRDPIAQRNELLLKVLVHNLCVLVMSAHQLDAPVTFSDEATSEAAAGLPGQA